MSKQRFGWRSASVLFSLGAMLTWATFAPAAQPGSRFANFAAAAANKGGVPASAAPSLPGDIAFHPGGRDPFKLPPPPLPASANGGAARLLNLPPGVRGLMIGSLTVEGIVSENSGREMIAVVTNDMDRAYFLRTNEQLYDGAVTRITPQEVFFTKRLRDRGGRESAQVVVKRLNPKVGDAQ